MRVTHLNKYYPPHLGGIEYHVRDLAEAQAAAGHSVKAIVANEAVAGVQQLMRGVDVSRVARFVAVSSTPVALGYVAAIRKAAPDTDIFHLHFPYPWGEAAFLTARVITPAVMTYHSDIVRQRAGLAVYRPVLERALARMDAVIASSPNMVEHSPFLSRIADKCRVIPFGIHAERYEAKPEVLARASELRAGHERPIVLFVGRLIYYKGVDVLVEAMAGVDADLVIVGQGPLEGMLRERAAALRVLDRITFLPFLADDDLIAWYHAADVFCLPSVARSEAFGLVQLEAHAAGTPVVSTRLTTGVPYVNQDGVTGLTVEPGDVEELAAALNDLARDAALRERLGRQARARVLAEFTTERMVERILELYRDVIDGRAG